MQQDHSAADIADAFAASFASARLRETPFRHWLLTDMLPDAASRAIADLPALPAEIGDTQGRRETHNSSRRFFAPGDLWDGVCAATAEAFQAPDTVAMLAEATGAPLNGASLRIEYCQDRDGFWLEPHTDIGAKLFTMLVYLGDDPAMGTDIYDSQKRHLGAAPFGMGRGLIFVPGSDTWHGFERRPIKGLRKSIIINYVKPEWRSRHELAFANAPVLFPN
jgi:hypothetical protein